jgi:hypoxanthine phosphoribosyltransferase
MKSIKIKDKEFVVSIPESYIRKKVSDLAARISADLAGKNPLFLGVLNGSFMFAADLFREITIPAQISFVKLASYEGTLSTGVIKEVIGLSESIKDRCVVVVEDIIDSGLTMQSLVENLGTREPSELYICTLLLKPANLQVPLNVDYVALEIPNEFIVGYGLDYDGWGRNLRDIYTVVNK